MLSTIIYHNKHKDEEVAMIVANTGITMIIIFSVADVILEDLLQRSLLLHQQYVNLK